MHVSVDYFQNNVKKKKNLIFKKKVHRRINKLAYRVIKIVTNLKKNPSINKLI